jgi:hypothetical protein
MKRALLLVAVVACGGGGAKPAPAPPTASTACLPAGFEPDVFRVDGARVHVCDENTCATVDVPDGRWSEVSAAEAEATRALDVVGGNGVSIRDGVVEVCEGTDCTTFDEPEASIRGAAYDDRQDLLAWVTEDASGSTLYIRHAGVATSMPLDAPRALTLAFVGPALLVAELLVNPLTLEAVFVGGGERWYAVGGWAPVSGTVWAFGDIYGAVVLQDVATGEVRHAVEVWETAGNMLGPEQVGDDLVVVRGAEVVVISAAGEIRGRFTAPACT